MNKETAKKKIKDIIEDTVDITEGPYGWSGPTMLLTRTDEAAQKIIDFIISNSRPRT